MHSDRLANPMRAAITAALIATVAVLTFVGVALLTSDSEDFADPALTEPNQVRTDIPSTADDPVVTGPQAQLIWAQFVHDTVHGLEKLLKAAVDPAGACAQLCNPLPDPKEQLEGALRWCGQSGPGVLANPRFNRPDVHEPLVAVYAGTCTRLLARYRETGSVHADETWIALAAHEAAILETARAEFRRAALLQGWAIIISAAR